MLPAAAGVGAAFKEEPVLNEPEKKSAALKDLTAYFLGADSTPFISKPVAITVI